MRLRVVAVAASMALVLASTPVRADFWLQLEEALGIAEKEAAAAAAKKAARSTPANMLGHADTAKSSKPSADATNTLPTGTLTKDPENAPNGGKGAGKGGGKGNGKPRKKGAD